jgi:hypothetical protein
VEANVFGIRLTDSKFLHTMVNPVGNPLNDENILAVAINSAKLVVAWGKLHKSLMWRDAEMREFLHKIRKINVKPLCFGLNLDKTPKHPLYLPDIAPLMGF